MPDRFYCTEHAMTLEAGTALRTASLPVGHVGWAFRTHPTERALSRDDDWHVGSFAATKRFIPINLPGATDTPLHRTNRPEAFFGELDYIEWKGLVAEDGNVEAAILAQMQVAEDWSYALAGSNCLDAAVFVLEEFGVADLPKPLATVAPVAWFSLCPGRRRILEQSPD